MKDFKVRIGCYTWQVKFVPKEEINGCDGRTFPNDFKILVRNDLNPIVMRSVFIHEVVHALLDTQGRCYQRKFDLEDVCEFIAWRFNEIQDIIETYERNQKQ